MYPPTATHSVVVGHDTASRSPVTPPAGSGGVTAFQVVPFHFSASGASRPPSPAWPEPTATHSLTAGQDTPSSWLAAVLEAATCGPLSAAPDAAPGSAITAAAPTATVRPAVTALARSLMSLIFPCRPVLLSVTGRLR